MLESVFWLGELFNAVGLFLVRGNLGMSGWWCAAYVVVWFGAFLAFFLRDLEGREKGRQEGKLMMS